MFEGIPTPLWIREQYPEVLMQCLLGQPVSESDMILLKAYLKGNKNSRVYVSLIFRPISKYLNRNLLCRHSILLHVIYQNCCVLIQQSIHLNAPVSRVSYNRIWTQLVQLFNMSLLKHNHP